VTESIQVAIVTSVAAGALLLLVRPLLPRRTRGSEPPPSAPPCKSCAGSGPAPATKARPLQR
jgi:hypothetical protein